MGTDAATGAAVVTAEVVTVNGNPSVRVKVTRDFSFIPSGNGGGLPTSPFAQTSIRPAASDTALI